ncbi:hypothetical protein FJY94_08055 [Candidatus Kaiserbacteria bacterium]|nr:hypothetical protein [Candidatus Kaiserbacteria bacterium]
MLGCASQALAQAQDATGSYARGPIKLVVPFPPGSGADTTARTFAQVIGRLTGQSAIVENKAGANGVLAVQAVLQVAADGHTILLGSNSTLLFAITPVPRGACGARAQRSWPQPALGGPKQAPTARSARYRREANSSILGVILKDARMK